MTSFSTVSKNAARTHARTQHYRLVRQQPAESMTAGHARRSAVGGATRPPSRACDATASNPSPPFILGSKHSHPRRESPLAGSLPGIRGVRVACTRSVTVNKKIDVPMSDTVWAEEPSSHFLSGRLSYNMKRMESQIFNVQSVSAAANRYR